MFSKMDYVMVVVSVMPPKTQEAEGIKLAVCIDPDGLSISFAESLRM